MHLRVGGTLLDHLDQGPEQLGRAPGREADRVELVDDEQRIRELRASRVNDGILGSFGFDTNGDITTASIPILRITGATPAGASLPPEFQGATVDRVVQVPTRLVE